MAPQRRMKIKQNGTKGQIEPNATEHPNPNCKSGLTRSPFKTKIKFIEVEILTMNQ